MKKIINITILMITIPIITTILLTKTNNKKIKFNIEKNEKETEIRVKRENLSKIEILPLEEYLVGVLAGEMPSSYDIEALKAQAVAARTYALKKITTNQNQDYDVVDTTNDQVYLDEEQLKNNWKENYEENLKKIKQAITETNGEYLTYNGKIIKAFFFSTSSGTTENCEDVFGENLPYLVSVASTWDEKSPSYESTITFTKQEFYNKLKMPYENEIKIEIKRNQSNSINTIKINNQELKGTDFRFKLGLRSTNLEIKEMQDKIIITSKGYGHGVGMSQYGALALAQKGYNYQDILKYYYQGIDIKKI